MISTCRDHGVAYLEGPFSPHEYGVTGIQLDGFNIPPVFGEAHNPPYYNELLRNAGFHVAQTGRTWRRERAGLQGVEKLREMNHDSNEYTIRPLQIRRSEDVQAVAAVIESAFTANWHSRKISVEEYVFTARSFSTVYDPSLTAVAEHKGRPVGILVTIPDLNEAFRMNQPAGKSTRGRRDQFPRRNIRSLLVYAIGIIPEHRNSRIGYMLAKHFECMTSGYEVVTSTWITRGNRAVEWLAERFGFCPVKTFAVYGRQL
jgi:hypothetical protein